MTKDLLGNEIYVGDKVLHITDKFKKYRVESITGDIVYADNQRPLLAHNLIRVTTETMSYMLKVGLEYFVRQDDKIEVLYKRLGECVKLNINNTVDAI